MLSRVLAHDIRFHQVAAGYNRHAPQTSKMKANEDERKLLAEKSNTKPAFIHQFTSIAVVVSDQGVKLNVVREVGRFPLRTEQHGANNRSVLFNEQSQSQRVIDVSNGIQRQVKVAIRSFAHFPKIKL